jgi:hypothetical protein
MNEAKRVARGLLLGLGVASLLGTESVQAAGDPDVVLHRMPREIDVLTLNQYFGASLQSVLAASAADFNAALLQVLTQAASNNVRARLERQAEAIARRRPDLVGLQEVLHAECHDLPPTPGACADPSIAGVFVDQLDLTLQALRAHHAGYDVAARVQNFDIGTVELALPGLGSLVAGAGQALPGHGNFDHRDISVSLPELGDFDPRDLLDRRDIAVPLPQVGNVQGVPFTINGKFARLVAYDQDVILSRHGIATAPVAFACDGRQSAQGCN